MFFGEEGFLIGIVYRYTNKVNGKSYIGKTINPENRHRAHLSSSRNSEDRSYNNPFPRAIRKYGIENFRYEVLLETDNEKKLFEAEIDFIDQARSRGEVLYNISDGGEGNTWSEEDKEFLSSVSQFKNALLDREEVVQIRLAYLNNERPSDVWERYPQFTNYYSFMNVWTGARYGYVMPEVFSKRKARTRLNTKKAADIRELYKTGEHSYKTLAEIYGVGRSTIRDVIKRRTFK